MDEYKQLLRDAGDLSTKIEIIIDHIKKRPVQLEEIPNWQNIFEELNKDVNRLYERTVTAWKAKFD